MNDDELREHLRTTLDPVDPGRPDLVRLRRLARRRRRRLQATSAVLGLLLVVGTGIGIAAAVTTSGGPGRVEVLPAGRTTAPSADVTLPCDSAPPGPPGSPHVRGISMASGQSLAFVDCPTGARATAPGGNVLTQTGALTFEAVGAGSEKVVVTVADCAEPPASMLSCFGRLAVRTFEVVVSGSVPTPVAQLRTAPCTGGHITVSAGDRLTLTDCPVGLSSHVDDPSILATGTTSSEFRARNAGTTNVDLLVRPVCTPGAMCPRYVRDLGTLVVTVTAAR